MDHNNIKDERILKSIMILHDIGFTILTTRIIRKILLQKLNDDRNDNIKDLDIQQHNVIELLYQKKIDMVINISNTMQTTRNDKIINEEYQIRRKALELGIPVLTTIQIMEIFIKTLQWRNKKKKTSIQPLNFEI